MFHLAKNMVEPEECTLYSYNIVGFLIRITLMQIRIRTLSLMLIGTRITLSTLIRIRISSHVMQIRIRNPAMKQILVNQVNVQKTDVPTQCVIIHICSEHAFILSG